MNNNPIGWPDSAFGYNSSTQTLAAPNVAATNVAATKLLTVNATRQQANLANLFDLKTDNISSASIRGHVFGGSSARLSLTNSNGGTGAVTLDPDGLTFTAGAWASINLGGGSGSGNGLQLSVGATAHLYLGGNLNLNWQLDTYLWRDSANALALRNAGNAQTYRVYNTYTSSTNYERGKLEWASNTFRVGTEKGSGGGTARSMALQTDAIDRLTLDTIGSVRVATALTVATLPGTPTVGMIARVTDASAPTIGSTVAGGGAAAALCWYNGTDWTVLGI